jgi:hypothetical protein
VYFFRLRESSESPNWLVSANSEPRQNQVDSSVFVYGPQGDSPSAYTPGYDEASFPSRLLDRATESITYNEDVPVFELPRSPLLSLGMLQHLAIDGARPFSIGNSWGATTTINSTSVKPRRKRELFCCKNICRIVISDQSIIGCEGCMTMI